MEKTTSLRNSKIFIFPFILALSLFISCSKEDDNEDTISEDTFYSGSLKSATAAALQGTWSIYTVEFEGQKAAVPSNYPSCGRDFFTYMPNGIYKEYLIQDTSCIPFENELNYELQDGIITISNSNFQSEEYVIIKLDDELVFKVQTDLDEDGIADILTITARKYIPNDIDIYSNTFIHKTDDPIDRSQIGFSWQKYEGFNDFDRYEIYRTVDGCNNTNGELIAKIEDVNTLNYVDENPPATEQLCYFFRVYTNKGLLGESYPVSLTTNYIAVPAVELAEPVASSENITLNWQKYEGRYFSHYEIRLSNYYDSVGYDYQEEIVKTINDIDTSTFIDIDPPYFKDPVYTVLVYDIFGNKNVINNNEIKSSRTATFKRPEILELDLIEATAIDNEQPILYLLVRDEDYGDLIIQKYNYASNSVEAISNKPGTTFTNLDMQIIQSPSGKEIVLPQYSYLDIYNAENLQFKYSLKPIDISTLNDYLYLGNNLWVVADQNNIYTYKRDNANFTLVDKKAHFTDPKSTYKFHMIALKNNQILIGHFDEPNSISFIVNSQGQLTEKDFKDIPLKSKYSKKSFYNPEKNYIINFLENRIYSTTTFSYSNSFETPYFPTGLSNNGNIIFGSNNDSEWQIEENSLHEKKVIALDLNSNLLKEYSTKGYPQLVFQNYMGKTVSLSSGLKRQSLESETSKRDLFIEVVE